MKVRFATIAAVLALVVSGVAVAQADDDSTSDGPWMVRIRAIDSIPANSSDAIPVAGIPTNGITTNTKFYPEIDGSYFLSKNIAMELSTTYPQSMKVFVPGGQVGTFSLMPTTLALQFHTSPGATIQPYLGVGVNYSMFTSQSFNTVAAGGGAVALNPTSWGAAFQAGFDYKMARHQYINVDAKVTTIATPLTASGPAGGIPARSVIRITPWTLGLGYGFRFK